MNEFMTFPRFPFKQNSSLHKQYNRNSFFQQTRPELFPRQALQEARTGFTKKRNGKLFDSQSGLVAGLCLSQDWISLLFLLPACYCFSRGGMGMVRISHFC